MLRRKKLLDDEGELSELTGVESTAQKIEEEKKRLAEVSKGEDVPPTQPNQ